MATARSSDRRTGAETRAEILRVALGLFTEKGFASTSTRDISEALGITKSALYYHFRNKDEIVTSLVQQRRHDLDELVNWIAAQPRTPDLLQRAALRWIESTTPERLQAMRLIHANEPVLRRLVECGQDVRSGFERVIALLCDDDATEQDRLLTRMVFDTVSAALLAAQRTDASPSVVIAAARVAAVALSQRSAVPAD